MRTLYLGPEYDLSSIKGEDVTYDDVAEIIAGRELVALCFMTLVIMKHRK